jgi:hypothetical protein
VRRFEFKTSEFSSAKVSTTDSIGCSIEVLFLIPGQMIDIEPIGFEVNRDGNDGEKLRVLYSRPNDKFFQLQESINECSTFVNDQIMKRK